MFKKILGSNKQSENGKAKKGKKEFYLEIKEDDNTQDSNPVEPTHATEAVVEATESPTTESKPAKVEKVTPKTKTSQDTDTPAWVQLLYKNKDNQGSAAEENTTFADKYLLPTPSNTRRRPGGSLSKYMDMASQVKSPQMKR